MKKLTILAIAALVLAFVAGPVFASNTGFKLNRPLIMGGRNFVSFPYFYFPSGVTTEVQNSLAVCRDIATSDCGPIPGGPITVVYVDKVTATRALRFTTQSCVAPFPVISDITTGAPLVGGNGGPQSPFFINMSKACTADIVGSHDDSYSLGTGTKKITVTDGNDGVAVPYHITANNARELCTEIARQLGVADGAANPITTIARFKRDGTGVETQSCAGPVTIVVFPVEPGDAYYMSVRAGTGSRDFDWNHY